MSFDIFLCCVQDKDVRTFKIAVFDEIFGRHHLGSTPIDHSVTHADGGASVHGLEDGEDVESLMFNHFGGDTFYSALHELMLRTGSVLYWPDQAPNMAVADDALIAHLPEDFEGFGPAFVVANGKELERAITGGNAPSRPVLRLVK